MAESIEDPATKSRALVHLADRLPAAERDRKLALLDRALLQARIATDQGDRLLQMGEVAERWFELGEVDKAKGLFAEGLQIAKQFTDKTDIRRGLFACSAGTCRLAGRACDRQGSNGDPSREGSRRHRTWAGRAEPGRSRANLEPGQGSPAGVDGPTLCWKMATVDPAAARRVIEGFPGSTNRS